MQFLSFEWRNGSQNRNVLEKLSGTGPFWKFWLFGQGQESTWSKHFFFPFFLNFFFLQAVRTGSGCGSVRVKPGQTLVGGDVMDDVTALDAYGTCAHVARVARALAPTVWRVCTREIWWRHVGGPFVEAVNGGSSGGAWWRVAVILDLKFSSFVYLRP